MGVMGRERVAEGIDRGEIGLRATANDPSF